MLKLLIVDDEYITRRGIKKNINFEEFSITKILEADDGLNALEVAKTFQPDIVISDIKMPRMDGIEFAFKLRKIQPNCRLIFMSAYTEIDYYRNAIKLNAVSYIEKPIDLNEMKMALKNAVDDLLQYIEYENLSKKINQIVNDNKYIIKSQLSAMLIQKDTTFKDIKKKASELGLSLKNNGFYTTAIIKNYTKENLDPHISEQAKTQVNSILNKFLSDFKGYSVWHYKGNTIIFNFIFESQEPIRIYKQQLLSVLNKIYKELETFCQPNVGIGEFVTNIEDLYKSYNTAVITSIKLFFEDKDKVAIYNNNLNDKQYYIDKDIYTKFTEFIEKGAEQDCITFIHKITEEIRKCTNTNINDIKNIYYELAICIENYMDRTKLLNEKGDNLTWNKISSICYLSDLEKFLILKVKNYFNELKEQNEMNSVALRIAQFINQKYTDPFLSIDDISSKVGLSSNYLCAVFKKEMGITINKYITQVRINKSKELLKDYKLKIEEIAQKVGYQDSDYFSKVFKKYSLCSPTEYRKKYLI